MLVTRSKKKKNPEKNRMTKEEIKEQLILSILEYEKVETTDLNEKVDKVEKCDDAAIIVKEYEDVICSKKENIMCLAYQ